LIYIYRTVNAYFIKLVNNWETVVDNELVEALKLTCELLVWGDQNDRSLIEYLQNFYTPFCFLFILMNTVQSFFLENFMFSTLVKLLQNCKSTFVEIYFLQCFTILFGNIRSQDLTCTIVLLLTNL
jgi:hypothetical protein